MSKLKYYDGTNWKVVNGQITGDTLPIGAIVPFGGWDAPTGWLICDGTLLNKTAYPELFNAIGYSFGGEEGGSTFGLPDLRGRVPLGLKETDTDFDGMGLTGGEKTHTLTVAEMPSHDHEMWADANETLQDQYGVSTNSILYNHKRVSWAKTSSTGGGQAHNNLQPYQTVNYIIKAKQSAGLVANVSNTYSTSQSDTYSCDYENKYFGGVELYSNNTGSSSEITLSDDISNYSKIKIFYFNGSISNSYEFIPLSGATQIAIESSYQSSTSFIHTIATYSCSSNKLTPQTSKCGYYGLTDTSISMNWDNTVYSKIFKVIGYK